MGIALILGYFYYFQPFATTNPYLFSLAFVAWAAPPALVGWFYRNATRRRANTAVGRTLVAFGVTGIFLYVLSTGTHLLDPLVLSAWPAIITGAIVGSDSALISRHRKERAKSATEPRKAGTHVSRHPEDRGEAGNG